MDENKLSYYENQPVRAVWDETAEEWYFSVVDVVQILTEQMDRRHAAKYWSVLKTRLKNEGMQLTTICSQLKMEAEDGKRYMTDVADMQGLLRIIQSIPSRKAEPFKLWLAQVGAERIDETIDPEQAIDRALTTYQKMGYPEDWIHQRLLAIRIRNELTDEWQKRGVEKGKEYAILTDEITKAWSGLNTRQYKNLKGLKKENLRDNMTDTELVLNMLAEASTRDISKKEKPQGLEANRNVAKRGGAVAGTARKNLEKETGESVISNQNAVTLGYLVNNLFLDVVKDKEE